MIKIILPNFYQYFKLNAFLKYFNDQHMNYMRLNNLKFIAAEGTIPYSVWGQSVISGKIVLYNDLINFGTGTLPIVFDCSNINLQENDLFETKENIMLSANQNGTQYLLVSSPGVLDLLQQKYPYFNYIASEFFPLEQYNSYETKFDYIRKYLTDDNMKINKAKTQIILPTTECAKCPKYEQCIQLEQLAAYHYSSISVFKTCENIKINFDLTLQTFTDAISQGYTNFCINSTALPGQNIKLIVDLYTKLFIQPEYQLFFYQEIQKEGIL